MSLILVLCNLLQKLVPLEFKLFRKIVCTLEKGISWYYWTARPSPVDITEQPNWVQLILLNSQTESSWYYWTARPSPVELT